MTPRYSPMTITVSLLILGTACAAPQDRQPGLTKARVPILYEAYYPEQRKWVSKEDRGGAFPGLTGGRDLQSPRAGLEEIQKLRELTSKLLNQEEELGKLAAAAAEATPENIFEPRGQILEYVFSGPAMPLPQLPPVAANDKDDVQVASITVTDGGRRRTRHHHGDAEWMLRRVEAPSA